MRLRFSTTYSTLLTIHSFINFVYRLWKAAQQLLSTQKILIDKVELIRSSISGFTVFFIYLYFLLNSRGKLIMLLTNWKQANTSLRLQLRPDRKYPIFCTVIIIVVLSSSITENYLFDQQFFNKPGRFAENVTLLEKYYWRSGNVLTSFAPYSPILSIFATILSKCATYVWNTSDIFVIIFCKSFSDLIKKFNEYITHKFQTSLTTMNEVEYSRSTEKLLLEFRTILKLAEETTRFLSPLVVICYIYNIYLMVFHLFGWLDPRGIAERSLYVYVSFLQFTLRVILVTYHASNIHHSTEQIEESLELIPDEMYSQTIERLERQLARNPVGISLFGTFRVTRRFFISVISFLFTTEIVLLQTASPSSS